LVKRIVGAVLFGLGFLLVVFGLGLALFVAPSARQLPYDLERSKSVAVSETAEYLQVKDGVPAIQRTGLASTVEVLPQARLTQEEMTGPLSGKAVVWDVYSEVRRTDNQELISAYSTELAIDRRSGAAADWSDAWLRDGSESAPDYEGQVYKFPFGTERTGYQVYDRDLRRATPATFKAVETVRGVETYRFEQVIPEEQIPVAEDSLAVLLSTFAPQATSGQVVYSNTRTYWVEPTTGAYVDLRDRPRKELVASDGTRTVLLDAEFRYDEATAAASAKRAADNAGQLRLVGTTGPIVLGVAGALALIFGLVLVVRADEHGRHRMSLSEAPAAESVPAESPASATAAAEAGRRDGPITDTLPPPDTDWAPRSKPAD
jgi:hypothetical protein